MTNQLVEIPFYAQTLIALETPDGPFVPLKPMSEALGLDPHAQRKRVMRHKNLYGAVVMASPSAGGTQEMTCIPVYRVAMWLATIQANRVSEDLRDMLEVYQMDAADVLDRHFRQKAHAVEGALERSHAHLLAVFPRWAKIVTLLKAGVPDFLVQKRSNMTDKQFRQEMAEIERCGLLDASEWQSSYGKTASEELLALRLQVMSLQARNETIAQGVLDV